MSEKRTLPLLPLRGLVVYPHMMVNLDVGRDRSVAAIESAIAGGSEVLVVAQRDPDIEDPTERDLYDVGTVVAHFEHRGYGGARTRGTVVLDDDLRVLGLDGLDQTTEEARTADTSHVLEADLGGTSSDELVG